MSESGVRARVRLRPTPAKSLHSVTLSEAVLDVSTSQPIEFIDLTDEINRHLAGHAIDHGLVTVFSRHTTAAIKINEAEELLLEDFKAMLHRLCPVGHRYNHNDMSRRKPPIAPDERANAHSHCMHLLLSTSETIPVVGAQLALGTWQRVFLVELDGPRERQVILRCAHYMPLAEDDEILALSRAQNGRHRADGRRNGNNHNGRLG